MIDEEDDDDDGAELVVPSVDAEGKPIPEWKKKVLEKKVEHKKQKRAVKQQKVGVVKMNMPLQRA